MSRRSSLTGVLKIESSILTTVCKFVTSLESRHRDGLKGRLLEDLEKLYIVCAEDVNVCVKRHKNHIQARSTEYIPELEINLPVSDYNYE